MKNQIEILAKSVHFSRHSEPIQNNILAGGQNYVPTRQYRPKRIFNSIQKQVKKDMRNYGQ